MGALPKNRQQAGKQASRQANLLDKGFNDRGVHPVQFLRAASRSISERAESRFFARRYPKPKRGVNLTKPI